MKNSNKILKFNINSHQESYKDLLDKLFPEEIAAKTIAVHSQITEYFPTKLQKLNSLAKKLGLNNIWVKDESSRFNIKAFKALGSSYAIFNLLKRAVDGDNNFQYKDLHKPEIRQKLGNLTLATTTDGNHGKGVAWVAKKLGYPAVVYMPKGTVPARIKAIEELGAKVEVIDSNYDMAVNKLAKDAAINNWTTISDTSWDGYEEIPIWVQQGYCTLFQEAQEELNKTNEKPTHVFIQAGVGALAVAAVGYYLRYFGDHPPKFIILEPHNAACLFESSKTEDGHAFVVDGDHNTIMAGLACGVPSPTAWPLIKAAATAFISSDDILTKKGIKRYANPIDTDPKVISGESGAIGLGVIEEIMSNQKFSYIRQELRLDQNSNILMVNTEGDTDPENYQNILNN
jgi:diaminopropionate ammonia-lyase